MKKHTTIALALAYALPLVASAQAFAREGALTGYLTSIVGFINNYIIPLIIAAAILSFIWGMFSYFILGGADEERRGKGQQLMIWAVVGLVLMLSIQGIVNIFADAVGLQEGRIDIPQVPSPRGS